MCPLFCFHLQAPPSTDDMPGEITGPLGADPADVVDAEGGEGEAEEFSDNEGEFGEDFLHEHPSEKMDCPKACYASGDCHDLD